MFSDVLKDLNWNEISDKIKQKTDADVRKALSKRYCDIDDFMALISEAASPYLENMALLSRQYTQERFGKNISMFVPLYLTNSCVNSCVYCGFNCANKTESIPRQIRASVAVFYSGVFFVHYVQKNHEKFYKLNQNIFQNQKNIFDIFLRI